MSNTNELCTNKVLIHDSLGSEDRIPVTIRCAAAAFGDLSVDQRTSVLQRLDSRAFDTGLLLTDKVVLAEE